MLAHSKVDGETLDTFNAVNDDCVAAIHDWASLTAAMWPCATPLPERAPHCSSICWEIASNYCMRGYYMIYEVSMHA